MNYDSKVDEIRRRLGRDSATGTTHSLSQVVSGRTTLKVVKLTLQALGEVDHPFNQDVNALDAFAQKLGPGVLFAPRRGSSNPGIARHWETQFLIMLVARAGGSYLRDLSGRLDRTEKELMRAREAAVSAPSATLVNLGVPQFYEHLDAALGKLEWEESRLPFRLTGGVLKFDDASDEHLSNQEATLLSLLIESRGKSVPDQKIRDAGISDPAHRVMALRDKLGEHGGCLRTVKGVGYLLVDESTD